MYDYTRIIPSNTKIPFDHATLEDRQSFSCQFNVRFPQTHKKTRQESFPSTHLIQLLIPSCNESFVCVLGHSQYTYSPLVEEEQDLPRSMDMVSDTLLQGICYSEKV